MIWLLILIALAAGAANPLQSGANAELNKSLGHPVAAALWVYASGLTGMLMAALILRLVAPHALEGTLAKVSATPWWAWLGGVVSLAPTLAGLTLAQKLGAGVFTTASVTSGVLISVLMDQFGWIGFRQHSTSPLRAVGCCLLIAGVWMVARF